MQICLRFHVFKLLRFCFVEGKFPAAYIGLYYELEFIHEIINAVVLAKKETAAKNNNFVALDGN